ncbi:MAG: hypothetical protein AAFP86_09855 [Planctomycetota bacterium]
MIRNDASLRAAARLALLLVPAFALVGDVPAVPDSVGAAQTERSQETSPPAPAGDEGPGAAETAEQETDPAEPAAEPGSDAEPEAPAASPMGQALERIGELVDDKRAAEAKRRAPGFDPAEAEALDAEIAELEVQIAALSTGVSESDFRGDDGAKFDLNSELEALVEPFVVMMKDATENARTIERLRRSGADARRREAMARRAVAGLERMLGEAQDPGVRAELESMRDDWQDRADRSRNLASALELQRDNRMSERVDTRAAAEQAASSFFRDRGLSLVYGFGAFALVFVALRLVGRAVVRARGRRNRRRSFGARLFDLAFHVVTVAASTGAMLAVFNLRHDWLLIGAFGVLLLALAWAGIKMIPGAIEQVTLLLNLGAVQEGERVLKDGVPYRVERLDLYTDLDNPLLEGARTTLPVRELIGLHSRPSGPNEPWFPTRRGDFVRLSDGVRGVVVSQSPEHVELRIAGGSRVTYATPDFLGASPDNLSGGYRAEVQFGIGYVHQAEATDSIVEKLRAHVDEGLGRVVERGHIRQVSVEILEAGDSAIVYEVEADMEGEAAPKIELVERSLARLCIEACNVHGWEIPFPQMVLHRAEA